jgi:hypothetical protein
LQDQTKKGSAVPKKSEEELTGPQWQARYNAGAEVARRQYCDIFKFWRGCRYKPCRRAKACRGGTAALTCNSAWDKTPGGRLHRPRCRQCDESAHLTGPEYAGRMVSATSWLPDRAVTKRR